MSIAAMTKVWPMSIPSTAKLVLLSLADQANDQGQCWPSQPQIAARCSISERAVRDQLSWLESENIIHRKVRAGIGTIFTLSLDDVAVPRQDVPPRQMVPVRNVVPSAPEQSAGSPGTTFRQIISKHKEPSTEPSATPMASFPEQGAKKKTSPISLPTWLKDCEASGVTPIPEDDPVFEFAESAGISLDLISLAWSEFKVRHGDGSKRQKDWRATFRNAVRGNWFKIWFVGNDGQVQISSQGRTLQAVHREAAA